MKFIYYIEVFSPIRFLKVKDFFQYELENIVKEVKCRAYKNFYSKFKKTMRITYDSSKYQKTAEKLQEIQKAIFPYLK